MRRQRLYSSYEVAERTRLTYRQLDHMVRTGYITPAHPALGSGEARRFDDENLRQLAKVKRLLDAGVSWGALRRDLDPDKTHARVMRALERVPV